MKKIWLVPLVVLCIMLTACSEKSFLQQYEDITTNLDDYIGKNITVAGYYEPITDDTTGNVYHFVLRKLPAHDGHEDEFDLIGYELRYEKEYPVLNDWIEVTGQIQKEELYGEEFPVIIVKTLTTLDARGEEFVEN